MHNHQLVQHPYLINQINQLQYVRFLSQAHHQHHHQLLMLFYLISYVQHQQLVLFVLVTIGNIQLLNNFQLNLLILFVLINQLKLVLNLRLKLIMLFNDDFLSFIMNDGQAILDLVTLLKDVNNDILIFRNYFELNYNFLLYFMLFTFYHLSTSILLYLY